MSVSQRPKSKGRTPRGDAPRVVYKELLGHMLSDMEAWIPRQIYVELWFTLLDSPEDLRDLVDRHTLEAESSLADGGFEAYACLRQFQSMIKKNVDWYCDPPAVRSEKSIAGFLACQEACREKNIQLDADRSSPTHNSVGSRVLNLAKTKIRDVLGVLTESKYLKCLREADFGPGSPYVPEMGWTDSRGLQFKIAGDQTCTREALPHAKLALALNDGWLKDLLSAEAEYGLVDQGEIMTVLKNAVIDRVIEKQPSLLVYLQKGIGTVMADQLLRIGIDLSTQARNNRAARRGSLDGRTATVDMTSASDLNARALIQWLFPGDWYQLLDDVRVKWGLYPDGTVVRHEMFSTMGNATTFPVQCLVFYAIAWASCVIAGEDSREIRVYGDDVICPVGAIALLFETLRYAGHKPNVQKTHVWGPMRESCGTDYVQGIDVRPVYVASALKDDLTIMSVHNRLALMAMMPLPRTLSYLRNRARDLTGPPDLGISTDEAMTILSEGMVRPDLPWSSGRLKRRPPPKSVGVREGLSLAVDSYFVSDPPPPSGYCSSYQSSYFTFRGYSRRTKPADETPEWLNWRAVLYGARLLDLSHKRTGELDCFRFPTSESTTFVPEKYVFWWSSVAEVRSRLQRLRAI
jgi:hypothetical protein